MLIHPFDRGYHIYSFTTSRYPLLDVNTRVLCKHIGGVNGGYTQLAGTIV